MIALLCFFLTLLTSPFKSKSRLEAENAALRHQVIVLQRRVSGRDYINLHWVSSSLGNNCRRSPYQRLVVTRQPDYDTFGGSLCTSSGHSSSTSSRIWSE